MTTVTGTGERALECGAWDSPDELDAAAAVIEQGARDLAEQVRQARELAARHRGLATAWRARNSAEWALTVAQRKAAAADAARDEAGLAEQDAARRSTQARHNAEAAMDAEQAAKDRGADPGELLDAALRAEKAEAIAEHELQAAARAAEVHRGARTAAELAQVSVRTAGKQLAAAEKALAEPVVVPPGSISDLYPNFMQAWAAAAASKLTSRLDPAASRAEADELHARAGRQ